MLHLISRYSTGFAIVIALASCTDEVDDENVAAADVQGSNGSNLNGSNLNGSNLNGSNLNGSNLNGNNPGLLASVSLEGVVANVPLDSVTLTATVFTGRAGSTTVTDFTGATFTGKRGDGSDLSLRVASVVPATAPATKWTYFVEYLDGDGQWYPICASANGALPAVALNGTWNLAAGVAGGGSHVDDPVNFTFACEQISSIAKCVADGYEPWASVDGVSLANHHQACVRMLRADYCGDGTSYTTNGRLVNLYDSLGIQVDTDDFLMEAEWDHNGSRCLTSNRRNTGDIPCFDPSLEASCGDLAHFDAGTLIMNEIP